MTGDQYLQGILTREAVDTGPFSPVRGVQTTLMPRLQEWAGNALASVAPSGSFAKGTANRSGTDIDLFIPLHSSTPAGRIFFRSSSARFNVAFAVGHVLLSQRASRIDRIRRSMRSQGVASCGRSLLRHRRCLLLFGR